MPELANAAARRFLPLSTAMKPFEIFFRIGWPTKPAKSPSSKRTERFSANAFACSGGLAGCKKRHGLEVDTLPERGVRCSLSSETAPGLLHAESLKVTFAALGHIARTSRELGSAHIHAKWECRPNSSAKGKKLQNCNNRLRKSANGCKKNSRHRVSGGRQLDGA